MVNRSAGAAQVSWTRGTRETTRSSLRTRGLQSTWVNKEAVTGAGEGARGWPSTTGMSGNPCGRGGKISGCTGAAGRPGWRRAVTGWYEGAEGGLGVAEDLE